MTRLHATGADGFFTLRFGLERTDPVAFFQETWPDPVIAMPVTAIALDGNAEWLFHCQPLMDMRFRSCIFRIWKILHSMQWNGIRCDRFLIRLFFVCLCRLFRRSLLRRFIHPPGWFFFTGCHGFIFWGDGLSQKRSVHPGRQKSARCRMPAACRH